MICRLLLSIRPKRSGRAFELSLPRDVLTARVSGLECSGNVMKLCTQSRILRERLRGFSGYLTRKHRRSGARSCVRRKQVCAMRETQTTESRFWRTIILFKHRYAKLLGTIVCQEQTCVIRCSYSEPVESTFGHNCFHPALINLGSCPSLSPTCGVHLNYRKRETSGNLEHSQPKIVLMLLSPKTRFKSSRITSALSFDVEVSVSRRR